MVATWQSFLKYRYLLVNLIKRDFKVKYRRSVLGILWSMLNPLLMMVILSAVFSYIFNNEIQYYPIYIMVGQLTFSFFSESTSSSMTSVLNAAPLIKKVYIPKYIFPMEKVLFSFVNIFFTSIALSAVILYFKLPLGISLVCVLPVLSLLAVFNLGVSLFLATLTVFFRDIIHLYSVLITALTYFTPIIYPVSVLPQFMQSLIIINPMYWYVETMRRVVMEGLFPTTNQWIACSSCAIVMLIFGLLVFKKNQDKFILYI